MTTGRRHIRAGSVHVTELIGKRLRPFELPGDLALDAEEPLDAGMLDSLLDADHQPPGSHRREPSKGVQIAKIAGLGVASFVLCASITIGSMITHQRREDAAASARPAMDISGEQALLPDLLNRAVPQAGMTGKPSLAGAPSQASDTIDYRGRPVRPADPPPAPPTSAAEEPLSKTEVVERFFHLAPHAPDRAFDLLDGTLLGTDLDQFTHSWAGVRDLQVIDVHEQGNDVLAVVRLRLPDGTYLRVQQLLDVANTLPRRIVGAEILSAQRN